MSDRDPGRRLADGSTWRDFCRALEEVGGVVLGEEAARAPLDRAEGLRYLTRLLRAGLDGQVEFSDPRFPGFFQLANETIKIGNDNPDNLYHNANVSGAHRYRIWGTRGSVPYLSFGTKSGGYETDGSMLPTGQIDSDSLIVDAKGRFEIQLSCDAGPGNWLPMQPTTRSLIVRQTFLDRAREEPARFRIERLGDPAPNVLDPEAFDASLQRAVAFVRGTSSMFVDWMHRYEAHVNQLPSDDQERCQRAGGDANIHYCQSLWRLAENEALLVEPTRIPSCASWNFQLSNYWMESLDYRYHRIHVNPHSAVADPEGRIRIVVAHRDPGRDWPNWLDTAGHRQGGMLFRWIGAKEYPPIATRVVREDELTALV